MRSFVFQQPAERSCHHSDYSTCGHRHPDLGSAGHPGKRHSLKLIAAPSAAVAGEGWRTPMDLGGSSLSSASANGYYWLNEITTFDINIINILKINRTWEMFMLVRLRISSIGVGWSNRERYVDKWYSISGSVCIWMHTAINVISHYLIGNDIISRMYKHRSYLRILFVSNNTYRKKHGNISVRF